MNYQKIINSVYKNTRHIKTGNNADYIPILAKVNPEIYSISICDIEGNLYSKGNYKTEVAIESISKLLTLAAAVKKLGTKKVFNKIGTEGSFLPFNSIVAAELSKNHTINPFLNQGAMATTSLLYKKNTNKFKEMLLNNISEFASRKLRVGKKIYESESKTNSVNMSLAYLLKSFERFYGPVKDTVDAYTYQCSVKINSNDLAKMAAVFANGGVSPITQKKLLTRKQTSYILNSLLSEGLYEYSNQWMAKTGGGVYAKSGVGGGLLIIIPNVCGIGIISPKLDSYGNSVRGISAGIMLSKKLKEPLFIK